MMVWACAAVVGAFIFGFIGLGAIVLSGRHESDRRKSAMHSLQGTVFGLLALALAFLAGWLAH